MVQRGIGFFGGRNITIASPLCTVLDDIKYRTKATKVELNHFKEADFEEEDVWGQHNDDESRARWKTIKQTADGQGWGSATDTGAENSSEDGGVDPWKDNKEDDLWAAIPKDGGDQW